MDRGISRYTVRELCEKFYYSRNVYYIWDEFNLFLKDKESPADISKDNFEKLFNMKVRYNEKEHQEYLKEKEKRNNA